MKLFLTNKTILLTLVFMLAFFPFASFIPPSPLFEFLHAIRVTVGLTLLAIYIPQVFRSFRTPGYEGVTQHALGMTLVGLSAVCSGMWSVTWRVLNYPRWMTNHDLNAFFIWSQILGFLYLVTAPSRMGGPSPLRWWTYAVAGFIAGMIFATFLAFINPATSWIGHSILTNGPASVLDGFRLR